jgi:hypothetical protein
MNQGLITATNVIPAASGYRRFRDVVPISNAADDTIRGIFAVKNDVGDVTLFAGDSGKLYKFNTGTNNLDNVSKAGGYSLTGAEHWRFVQFGDIAIAAGGVGETLQYWDVNSSTVWADVPNAPKADFLAVVRDFVWTANIDEGSGRKPMRVKWSGFSDYTSWTSGTDQSDFQDLPDAGQITGLVGGEYATILCERAIFRATYTGLPLVFQFDKVESVRGCRLAGSVCNYGHLTFFLADNGFHMFDGQRATPIGNEKIDKFFENDFNSAYRNEVSASVDPLNQIAVWSYPSQASPSGVPDSLLIYNYSLNRWSLVRITTDLVAPLFTSGYTVDDLDSLAATVDSLSIQLDSPSLRGGEFFFGAAVGNRLHSFTGNSLVPEIVTGEMNLHKGKHSVVTRVYPYYVGIENFCAVGTRNYMIGNPAPTFTTNVPAGGDGYAEFRADGRYHRFKFSFDQSFEFAQGFDVEAAEVGRR